MTEKQWLTLTEPAPMLEYLRGKASDRKLRLFAVACCHRIGNYLTDERSRRAVEVAGEYADGLVDRERLVAARDMAREAKLFLKNIPQTPTQRAANAAFNATRDTGRSAANNAAGEAARALSFEDHNHCDEVELRQQTNLIRCIFGNPFCPVSLVPAWFTDNVLALAQVIYEDRAHDLMPILGDALQDAGCDDQTIISHCRAETDHVQGCWLVDAILDRS